MIYLRLFLEFFKAGLFAVGGGLATLPFLSDMATSTGWFTHSQLADMVAVSESTPGPLGVNMATYVGYTVKGVPGAVIATLGLITPSVIIILIIALFLKSFRHNHFVEAAFECLRPASLGLITASGIAVDVYKRQEQACADVVFGIVNASPAITEASAIFSLANACSGCSQASCK